jgi:transcription factor SFP1
MEKEKPFNCDTCGKRYKNLNGLKYVSTNNLYIFHTRKC